MKKSLVMHNSPNGYLPDSKSVKQILQLLICMNFFSRAFFKNFFQELFQELFTKTFFKNLLQELFLWIKFRKRVSMIFVFLRGRGKRKRVRSGPKSQRVVIRGKICIMILCLFVYLYIHPLIFLSIYIYYICIYLSGRDP